MSPFSFMPKPPRRPHSDKNPFRKESFRKGSGQSFGGNKFGSKASGGHASPRSHDGPQRRPQSKGWDQVAGWYDKLVGDGGMDYHRNVILPATMRMLDLKRGEKVIDICCGQGVLGRLLIEAGAGKVLGVDASPKLIEAARERSSGPSLSFEVADATLSGEWANGSFDKAACLMAVHDLEDIEGLFRNVAQSLKPGGTGVVLFMHPCFRIPRQSHWGWDEDHKIQYRRLDRYGSNLEIPITTHPGRETGEKTAFYHRPLAAYLEAFGKVGLGVIGSEELYSHRRSQAGPRSRAEHRAAAEFPLFLALLVKRIGA